MPASFRGVQTHVRAQWDTVHAITSNVQRVSTILTTDFMAGPFWALGWTQTTPEGRTSTRRVGTSWAREPEAEWYAAADVPAPLQLRRRVGSRGSLRHAWYSGGWCYRTAAAAGRAGFSARGSRGSTPLYTASARGYWTYAMYDGEPPLLATIEYISKEPGHGDGITLLHRELQSLATATSERPSVSWFV